MNKDDLNRSFNKLSPSDETKERMLKRIEEESLKRKERPTFKTYYLPVAVAFLVMISVGIAGLTGNLTSREAMREANDMAVAEESAPAEADVQILSTTRSEYHVGDVLIEEGRVFVSFSGEKIEVEGVDLKEGTYFFEVTTLKNPLLREDILSLYPVEDGLLGEAIIKGQEDLEGSSVDLFLE